jgi:hypothetical protein
MMRIPNMDFCVFGFRGKTQSLIQQGVAGGVVLASHPSNAMPYHIPFNSMPSVPPPDAVLRVCLQKPSGVSTARVPKTVFCT